METLPSAAERQQLVSSFLEIAVGQTADTATQFLEATGWKLDDAVQLFYVGNEGGGVESSFPPRQNNGTTSEQQNVLASASSVKGALEDEVRAPLPVKRDTLYGDPAFFRLQPSSVVAFRNFDEESKRSAVWESSESSASTETGTRDNLASLYSPPFALMFQGPFDQAKVEASLHRKWLLVNLQSNEEFSSHMLNRDTWANEAVAETIRSNFIFWQVYHDTSEGKKVCTYYSLFTLPAVLIIDPITGQKMRAWTGMVHPERLLEDLLPFLDKGPNEQHAFLPQKRPRVAHDSAIADIADKESVEDDVEVMQAIAASLEDTKGPTHPATCEGSGSEIPLETSSNEKVTYLPLPEEPQGSKGLCRVGIRLPDGRRIQRKFLLTDSIKLLWSFCSLKLEDEQQRPFHFTQAIPGASKSLEYESDLTFEAASLSNSMISLVWD
ncbi:plant UBX domain-containing protein 7-like isoform X1 [Zingiber officinale]|uniref:plant UBX domain-containing protein 7-like isoform X1 n=1 Tax=Zingiber officinale TaxID=94328 RepID=UPI001C4BF325|nr:plant UBX domain-containing protein 7-like isoform X1 [Zingiber officinale]